MNNYSSEISGYTVISNFNPCAESFTCTRTNSSAVTFSPTACANILDFKSAILPLLSFVLILSGLVIYSLYLRCIENNSWAGSKFEHRNANICVNSSCNFSDDDASNPSDISILNTSPNVHDVSTPNVSTLSSTGNINDSTGSRGDKGSNMVPLHCFEEYNVSEDLDSELFLDPLTPEISVVSECDLSVIDGTNSEMSSDNESPHSILHNLRLKNVNRVIIGHININSVRNKINLLADMIRGRIDILLISETKIDCTFPKPQFFIEIYFISEVIYLQNHYL